MRHLAADRVFDPDRIAAAAEKQRRVLVDEGIGDAFVIAKRRRLSTRSPFADLQRRQDRLWNPRLRTRQRLALQSGQAGDAGDFFDQIGLAQHVGPPRGDMGQIARQAKSKRLQRRPLLGFRNVEANEAAGAGRVQPIGAAGIGQGAGGDDFRGFAAAEINDHFRC